MVALRKAVRRTHRTEPLLDLLEPRLRLAFLEVVKRIRDEHRLAEIETLLVTGQINRALEAVSVHAEHLAAAVLDGYTMSARDAATFIRERLKAGVTFDLTRTQVVQEMREIRLRVVQELTREQVAATRQALVEGVRAGANPRQTARAFRDSIGLTQRQEAAVRNFRRLLSEDPAEALTRALRDRRFDRSLERAAAGETALTQKQINRMVTRYRERYLKYRAEVIARTESLAAVHEGTEAMWAQAISDRLVDPNELLRRWVTAGDSRTRDSHRTMSGQLRPHGEAFVSGNGNSLRYPGDPEAPLSEVAQCRCAITTRIRPPESAAPQSVLGGGAVVPNV